MREIRRRTDRLVDRDCVFCGIIRGESPCLQVYEDSRVLAFADINPVSDGHTLVVPKAHADNLWVIPDKDLAAVHLASKKILNALTAALDPTGVAVLQLNGDGANQEVRHYHIHLIPRMGGDPALPMTDWDQQPGNMERIEEIGQRIRKELGRTD